MQLNLTWERHENESKSEMAIAGETSRLISESVPSVAIDRQYEQACSMVIWQWTGIELF